MSKLWGGRFAKQTDSLVHQFNASINFDVRMAEQDIAEPPTEVAAATDASAGPAEREG